MPVVLLFSSGAHNASRTKSASEGHGGTGRGCLLWGGRKEEDEEEEEEDEPMEGFFTE
jgi:hypothetical protein